MLAVRCHSISVCRGGGGEELCQMLFGNREGWRLSYSFSNVCVPYNTSRVFVVKIVQIVEICKAYFYQRCYINISSNISSFLL